MTTLNQDIELVENNIRETREEIAMLKAMLPLVRDEKRQELTTKLASQESRLNDLEAMIVEIRKGTNMMEKIITIEALTDVLKTEGGFVNYRGELQLHRYFAPVIYQGKYLGLVPLFRESFFLAPVALQDDFRVHRVKMESTPFRVIGPGEGTTTSYADHLSAINRSMTSKENLLKFIGVLDAATGEITYTPFE